MNAETYRKFHTRQSEHDLQKSMVRWFHLQHPGKLLYAVPNGGKRSKGEAGKMRAEGQISGVPDLVLAVVTSQYPALYIETKTQTGKPSDNQLLVQAYLRAQGYAVVTVRSLDEFQRVVAGYLNETEHF